MRSATCFVVGVLLAASSCGDANRKNTDTKKTTISGHAYQLGLLNGDTIEARDYVGAVRGEVLGSAEVVNGAWQIDVSPAYGDFLIEAEGMVAFALGVELGQDNGPVVLTPISTLVVAYAHYLVRDGRHSDYEAARDYAQRLLYNHFGGTKALTVPTAPLRDEQTFLDEEMVLGILLSGLHLTAKSYQTTADVRDLTVVLADDIRADGKFDGRDDLGRLGLGSTSITGSTLRTDLSVGVRQFLASPDNGTHFTERHFEEILHAIETSEAEIFDGADAPADYGKPKVEILRPTNNATVPSMLAIEVRATDPEGNLDTVEVVDRDLRLEQDAEDSSIYRGNLDTRGLGASLMIRVEATDKAGNTGYDEVTVNVVDTGMLSGVVFKGPLAQAEVKAYPYDPRGTLVELDSVSTNDGGVFSLDLGDYVGPLLLEVSGGQYTEEAYDHVVSLDRRDFLRAIVPDYSPETTYPVTVSPATTMAAELSDHLIDTNSLIQPADAAVEGLSIISNHFGNIDLLKTVPSTLSGQDCYSLNESVRYALYIAGFSQLSKSISLSAGLQPGVVVTAMRLVMAVVDDLQDGVANGLRGAQSIVVEDYMLSSYTLRNDLGTRSWILYRVRRTCAATWASQRFFQRPLRWLQTQTEACFLETTCCRFPTENLRRLPSRSHSRGRSYSTAKRSLWWPQPRTRRASTSSRCLCWAMNWRIQTRPPMG
jgi:hypothetical protein